jgi:hypothetical protein
MTWEGGLAKRHLASQHRRRHPIYDGPWEIVPQAAVDELPFSSFSSDDEQGNDKEKGDDESSVCSFETAMEG